MRGRLPVPTALKEIRGFPGHRPKNADEPNLTPAELSVAPPDNLTDEARAEWERLIPMLVASRVLTQGDLAIFALYCSYYAEWQQYDREMRKKGPYTYMRKRNAEGEEVGDIYTFWNPARTVRDGAAEKCAKYAAELGLTPSARSRVKKENAPDAKKSAAEVRAMLETA